jgi:hypothetical protein
MEWLPSQPDRTLPPWRHTQRRSGVPVSALSIRETND